MLQKIIMKNFKSFKNETIVDFQKTNYSILPQNVSDSGVLKGCIFVGPNASGKSNIILAIKLLLDFLFRERDVNSGMFKCMFNEVSSYSIEYHFIISGERIRYLFEIDTRNHFITEKLYMNQMIMLDRMGAAAKSYIAKAEGISYDENDVDKDTLFLRTLYFNTKFAGNAILKEWIEFLTDSVYINLFDRRIVSYGKREIGLVKHLETEGCGKINGFFNDYNFEQNVEYAHSSKGKDYTVSAGDNDEKKYVFFKRKGIEAPIPFAEESLGNQNLLRLLPAFLDVVSHGGMLLIDEFSSGFHNDLEELLVRYFMKQARNAQLLFVSHSTNLLSNSLLRPDQEYVVEFHDDEGSTVKRISTEQPRSAQNIEKMYVSGVFGGLPRYRRTDEDS